MVVYIQPYKLYYNDNTKYTTYILLKNKTFDFMDPMYPQSDLGWGKDQNQGAFHSCITFLW